MPKNIEAVTQRLAGILGYREAVKIAKNEPSKLMLERTIGSFVEVGKALKVYKGVTKYRKGQLTEEDMDGITEQARKNAEIPIAVGQARFEIESKKIVNHKKREFLQEEYEEKLQPISIPTKDGVDEQKINPLDIIHEIANFENSVYDEVIAENLKKRGVSSVDKLKDKEAGEIKKETESKIDEVVREIGMNYLRGQIPGPLGKYFMEKATKTVGKYIQKDQKTTTPQIINFQ